MADIYKILEDINGGLGDVLKECGFVPVRPGGAEKGKPPSADSGGITFEYKGENKALKIEYFNDKISLLGAFKEGEILAGDYGALSVSLLDAAADEKDVKYVVNEFSDTIAETFGGKRQKTGKTKLPVPVSKAAAKSGSAAYDPNTLASRFTVVYPDLREKYRENCEKYGTFLPEDFFVNYGAPAAVRTIKENDPVKMKRLFNLLNDVYEDGTNATQSLIVVTVLGALNNDQQALADCVDYMCEDMTGPVIQVNKYLASKGGRGAKARLENPPRYKPAKLKKRNPASNFGI